MNARDELTVLVRDSWRMAVQWRHRVHVLAHRAQFLNGDDQSWSEPYLFIKITNLRMRPLELTHAWFELPDGKQANVLDGVPFEINGWKTHEIWTPMATVAPAQSLQMHEVLSEYDWRLQMSDVLAPEWWGRVKFGHGPVLATRPNLDVPSLGRVAR